ncbi:LysR family transcriptional regulator [Pseudomonas sp. W2Oct36]|uniref:LysR family transcriptional regulator n=2 Tax=Pseudomonas TaxID=286 RepID=A0A1C2DHQ3_9PSED|nr:MULTISPECIES: LysR family transcriptional regulator [Pseudomonas]MBD8597633.1 LysR family transcriptional regulator [Pseudomonas sp. CFBP 8772]OCX14185.1 LysR family transcriptional regulator [Pseudomonas graminis]
MLPSLSSMVSRLRLKQLRLLIALDEHGSVRKASEIMALSQPGATKALQEIETVFGSSLFERTSKGLEANDLGRCVIRYARLIHTDLEHLREEMVGILKGQGGRLAIGTIMGAVPTLVDSLARLRDKQPELSISIVEDTSSRLLSLLDQGRVDVAICRTSVSPRPGAYQTRFRAQEPLVVVANPAHRLAHAPTLQLDDLMDSRWVVFPVNMPMRLTLEREFRQVGLSFPLYAIETSSTFTTLSLLLKDPNLVAVMPNDVAQMALDHGMLVKLPLTIQSTSEPYEIVTRSNVEYTASMVLLIEEMTGVGLDSTRDE